MQIKNMPTGVGDDIKIDASYAKGTTKHVIATSGNNVVELMQMNASFPLAGRGRPVFNFKSEGRHLTKVTDA